MKRRRKRWLNLQYSTLSFSNESTTIRFISQQIENPFSYRNNRWKNEAAVRANQFMKNHMLVRTTHEVIYPPKRADPALIGQLYWPDQPPPHRSFSFLLKYRNTTRTVQFSAGEAENGALTLCWGVSSWTVSGSRWRRREAGCLFSWKEVNTVLACVCVHRWLQ